MIIHVSPDAPLALQGLAATALALHIGGGALGIAAGGVALAAPKGARLHRAAGDLFVGAMLVAYLVGAAAAPFIHQPANTAGGVFAAYLVATAWLTVKRPAGSVGVEEVAGFLAAAGVGAVMAAFAAFGAGSPHGIDGVPWQAGAVFAALGAFTAALDLKVILAGGISGPARLARHLWRMCLGLFIGAASLFLGQPKVFPPPLRGSPVLWLPPLAVVVLMVYWLVRVRVRRAPRRAAAAAPAWRPAAPQA